MADPRDPRRSDAGSGTNSTTRWIGIAVVAVLVLAILGWLLGLFGGGTTEGPVADDPAATTAPADTAADPAADPAATGTAADPAATDAAQDPATEPVGIQDQAGTPPDDADPADPTEPAPGDQPALDQADEADTGTTTAPAGN